MKKKKTRVVRSFSINRARWKRGGGPNSYLLTDSGQMCCLGFYARACGFKSDEIRRISDLESLSRAVDDPGHDRRLSLIKPLLRSEGKIIYANDDEDPMMRGAARERELKQLFERVGVRVRFFG